MGEWEPNLPSSISPLRAEALNTRFYWKRES